MYARLSPPVLRQSVPLPSRLPSPPSLLHLHPLTVPSLAIPYPACPRTHGLPLLLTPLSGIPPPTYPCQSRPERVHSGAHVPHIYINGTIIMGQCKSWTLDGLWTGIWTQLLL